MLSSKKILLGITGSIAAYKSVYLIRLLIKHGAEVKVILTPDAESFVTPLTLGTLSKNEVLTGYVQNERSGTWTNHVELGMWADHFIIAPTTANTIAKMAYGISDNLLLGTYLSARCPVTIAPAMDLDMYLHASTQKNMVALDAYGVTIVPVGSGELASGLEGKGRMAEPEEIINYLLEDLKEEGTSSFKGKKVLVTAGPTYEPIDPVRFIGNRSSGKMGVAIANQFAKYGADVILVHGPISESIAINPKIEKVAVATAQEMFAACIDKFAKIDITVMAAAVADYTIANPADSKIKKKELPLQLELQSTTDILAALGKQKKEGQILCGFALETDNELKNAQDKLTRKNLDLIILNSLKDKGAGFQYDTNKITLVDSDNKITDFELKTKTEAAKDILKYIAAKLS